MTPPRDDHRPEPGAPPPVDAAERRTRAEHELQALQRDVPRNAADTQRLLHELQVHQIELEMQQEELELARSQMETALTKYRDLYDFAPVAFVTLDLEGIIRDSNLTFAALIGVERARLLKRPLASYLVAADRPTFESFLSQVLAVETASTCELRLQPHGQAAVAVLFTAERTSSRQECRIAVTDVTQRNRAAADRLLLSKLESTGILAGGIAHDFNNLLTVMLLELEQARALAPAQAPLHTHLDEATKAAGMARGLTQQLITFAQGGAPLRRPLDLRGPLRDGTGVALSGSTVRSTFLLPEDLWWVDADEGQLGQVIRNLVLNARQAMPAGGVVTVSAENTWLAGPPDTTLPSGDYVRVSLADQGCGIAPEIIPQIFDPYFSTHQRGTAKGMGLGLAICHAVIQKHEGAITVRSELGRGTTFQFLLPARPRPAATPPVVAPVPAHRRAHVLVMDDEDAVRNVLQSTLRRLGHDVVLAANGEQAIAHFRTALTAGRPFDLVMLDLTVRDGLGGGATITALHAIDPTLKAIVMSGYTSDPIMLQPKRHGFDGVLPKPFGTEQLRTALALLLASASPAS